MKIKSFTLMFEEKQKPLNPEGKENVGICRLVRTKFDLTIGQY